MLGAFGEVLVLDWGAAEKIDAATPTVAGTRGYMAPEQLLRESRTREPISIHSASCSRTC